MSVIQAILGTAGLVGTPKGGLATGVHFRNDPQLADRLSQGDIEGMPTQAWTPASTDLLQTFRDQVEQGSPEAAVVMSMRATASKTFRETATGESPEMEWLAENATALEAYRGEWLLIVATDLVAHSQDFVDILLAIRSRGVNSPFIYYVPRPDEVNFIAV